MSAPAIISSGTAAGGPPVGGGGTSSPSTIPRWTGPSTLGDSALVQPSGTTRMYAASNDASTYLHLYGGNDDTLPVLATLNNTNPATATFGWGFFNRSTDGNLQLSRKASSTTWSQVVTFERSTGNVGIGTASPAARLDVLGSTSAGYFRFKGGNTSAGYGEFQNSSGTSLGLIGNGGGGALSGGTVSDLVLRAEANLLLAIGNNERARIDSAGNFGIGTASPQARAHITAANTAFRGQLSIEATSAVSQITLYTGPTTTTDLAGQLYADVGAIGDVHLSAYKSTAAIRFETGTTNTERARIDSSGRLLVGTTGTPSSAAVRVVVAAASGGQQWHSQGLGGCAVVASVNTAQWYVYPGANVGSEGYLTSVKLTETGLDVTTASATPGIKLPATPGNADTQTLDCYQENYASNSWTPVIFGGTTAGTATYSVQEGFYTRWGNLIFCTATVVFSGHTGTGNLSLSGLPFAAKTAGSGTYRSSIIIEEGGGVKAILRLQSGTTATTTGVSIAASGNYVITFVYATN